jgi:hypothetical protein
MTFLDGAMGFAEGASGLRQSLCREPGHVALGKEFFAKSFFAENSLPRATWQALGKAFAEGF